GIPATDDPEAKLATAEVLLYQEGRVMRAREQVDGAIAIFEQRGDRRGLTKAYLIYAAVARAGGTNADPVVFRRAPPKPGPEELDHSDVYLERAAALATETDQLHLLAYSTALRGDDQRTRGNYRAACALFDTAIEQWQVAETKELGGAQQLPVNARNLPERVARLKMSANC
ncbi:MAG: hypothetical protein JO128_04365, partial [Alphaproteobacteria bacterium]|nr:hypothetical protein [Alphaproteobacteria bacterium]